VTVTVEDSIRAFEDFYAPFHDDILNYHASTVAEHLNNIRWGIYAYLRPEFERSIVWLSREPPHYRYNYPPELSSEFAKHCYWELMNEVRREPYMRRFKVTKWLKLRY